MEVFLAGSYSPSESKMYLADHDLERILTLRGRQEVKQAFKRFKHPQQKYKDLLRVAILAEESAHFVQHVRRELPLPWSEWEAQPATSDKLKIAVTAGLDIRRETVSLIRETVAKTFEVMDYTGNPPRGLIISKKHSVKPPKNPDFAEYYASGENGTHYTSKYPYEVEAKDVRNKVLE